jgi:hypothetical protein
VCHMASTAVLIQAPVGLLARAGRYTFGGMFTNATASTVTKYCDKVLEWRSQLHT